MRYLSSSANLYGYILVIDRVTLLYKLTVQLMNLKGKCNVFLGYVKILFFVLRLKKK